MRYSDALMKRVQEDVKRYKDRREVVRAGILEVLTVRHLSPDKMHANPDDEFSNPDVGPNEDIVEKYMEEARKDLEVNELSFNTPVMVAKMKQGDYMIVNGHHRWAAAVKLGLIKIRVVVTNPGWEDIVGYL